jgi:hypothetical protein
MGLGRKQITIYNDNMSTLTLLQKGPSSSGRTRWVSIKNLWIKEQVDDGRVNLEHVPSSKSLADGFTKIMTKERFLKWRDRILNYR